LGVLSESVQFESRNFFILLLPLIKPKLYNPRHPERTLLYPLSVIPTLIQGVAMAFFFIPLMTITLSGLSPDRIAAASGLSNFVRITAGSFGTSIATTLW
jgi:DHA2 family multidrug resistance protein